MKPDIEYPLVITVHLESGATAAVPGMLLYSVTDPYAVTLQFGAGGSWDCIHWVFGRDLLREVMVTNSSTPAGDCDITFTRGPDHRVHGRLKSPYGGCHFSVAEDSVDVFLRDTDQAVPFGTEPMIYGQDMDAQIEALLNGNTSGA